MVKRTVLTALIGIALSLVSAGIRAQAPVVASAGASTQESFALSVCQESTGGSTVIVSGPRALWSGRASATGALDVAGSFSARVRSGKQWLIAGNQAWVVLHDNVQRTTTRADCLARKAQTRPTGLQGEEAAVSDSGDVAMRTPTGDVALVPSQAWPSATPDTIQVVLRQSRSPVSSIVWVDRYVWLLASDYILIVDPNNRAYDHLVSLESHRLKPSRAFTFNGLLYVLEENGCLDVFSADPRLPRLREAACLPEDAATGFLIFDQERMRVADENAGIRWESTRVSAVTARLTGGVRNITASFAKLAQQVWVPKVPVGAARVLVPEPETAASTASWRDFLKPEFWASASDFQAALAVFNAKGWRDFHNEGGWGVADGLALQWQRGSAFVNPSERRLSDLALELYSKDGYTDSDVDEILSSNAAVARSLEGRLFREKWLPIGAILGSPSEPALPYAGLQTAVAMARNARKGGATAGVSVLLERLGTLGSLEACQIQPGEEVLQASAQGGMALIGRPGASLGAGSDASESWVIRSGVVRLLHCPTPGAPEPLAFIALGGIQLATSSGKIDIERVPSQATQAGRSGRGGAGMPYQQSKDGNWPVELEGLVIAGIIPPSGFGSAERSQVLRTWLDRSFRFKRIPQIRLPASFLEARFVVESGWQKAFTSVPGVTVIPGERFLASARNTGSCASLQDVTDRRKKYDELLKLPQLPRDIDIPFIGVLENAVDMDHPIFTPPGGTSAWWVLEGTRFVPKSRPMPVSGLPPDVHHGTQVAGLLFSSNVPTGLFSQVKLTWLTAASPQTENLVELAAQKDIVNVSQGLNPNAWGTLKDTFQTDYQRLLFVAAANNVKNGKPVERDDGLPIMWGLPNVIGVGVAMEDGSTPMDILKNYSHDRIDLVAPGISVPAFGSPAPECVDGTSYATAYVTAVAALVQAGASGNLDVSQIRARLLATATWRSEYFNRVRGGLVDAQRALEGLRNNENILKMERADGSVSDLTVTLDPNPRTFSATGNQPGLTVPAAKTIAWQDVLRLTRLGKPQPDPATGILQARYHLVWLDGVNYTTWDNVKINVNSGGLPVTTCVRRPAAGSVAAVCGAIDLASVVDYVAARPRRTAIQFR